MLACLVRFVRYAVMDVTVGVDVMRCTPVTPRSERRELEFVQYMPKYGRLTVLNTGQLFSIGVEIESPLNQPIRRGGRGCG